MNATFGMTLIVLVFSMSAVLKCGKGNVLRIDKSLSGILLSSDHDEEWNTVEIDNKNTVKAFNSHLDLDKSSNLRLKDAKTYDIGRLYNFHQKTDVHHFARHGLCRHDAGKIRLYKALKSKLCHSGGLFVAQLVDGLCKDKGVDLDIWVRELFDFDEDGNVNHFEKTYYDD